MRSILLAAAVAGLALAQAPAGPVISPRGVVNAFTQQPAPSSVAPGGLINIQGLNLGPAAGVKATSASWPAQLGDPAVEVLINGKPAPIFSASPDRIVTQVPWDVTVGLASVVVRRGGAESRPARIFINRMEPSVRTAADKGFGEVAGTVSGRALTIQATGLGPTQPRVNSGEAGPQDPAARPREDVRAFVGGLPAQVRATLSPERVGEFDVRIQLPAAAQPGDLVTLIAGSRAANRTTFQKMSVAEVRFAPLPEGTPEFRSLVSADLRGAYLIGSGARDSDGCYPSVLFDLARQQTTKIDACLTIGNPNARVPVVAPVEGGMLAALVGPPQGEPPAGVSSKVMIFSPARDEPLTVELPEPAVNLAGDASGDFIVLLAGTPPRRLTIDAETGEVREPTPVAGGAPAQPGGAFNPQIDLGDGLTHVVAIAGLPQNLFALIVTDSADQPSKAKVAVINRQAEVQGVRDFPDGWVPLVAPRPPARPGQPPPDPRVTGAAAARRVSLSFDAQSLVMYALSKKSDNSRHGLVAFGEGTPAVIDFPNGWFAAACSTTIPFFNLELARKLVILGGNAPETEYKDPCPGIGFILLDLDQRKTTAVPLPGAGQFDAELGASGDLNDFIYGSNTDPSRRNTADTLYVLDGVTASAFRMDLPPGVTSFANLIGVPAMNALIGLAANRAPGDAGFVLFDLERGEARVMPVPEGFAQVNLLGIFTATRKLVARGIRPGGAGSQYLIYDLVTGDLLMPPNPEGVDFVGGAAQQAGGGAAPPVLQQANPRAGTIFAIGYNSERKQTGVLVVRVP